MYGDVYIVIFMHVCIDTYILYVLNRLVTYHSQLGFFDPVKCVVREEDENFDHEEAEWEAGTVVCAYYALYCYTLSMLCTVSTYM